MGAEHDSGVPPDYSDRAYSWHRRGDGQRCINRFAHTRACGSQPENIRDDRQADALAVVGVVLQSPFRRLLCVWQTPQVLQQPYFWLESQLPNPCGAVDTVFSPNASPPARLLGTKLTTFMDRTSYRAHVFDIVDNGGNGWALDRLRRIHLLPGLGTERNALQRIH